MVAGYALPTKTLVYGKLSYLGNTAYSSSTTNRTGNGMGYGLGVMQMLTDNIFLQGEFVLNKFNDVKTGPFIEGGSTSVLSIGVGYKF